MTKKLFNTKDADISMNLPTGKVKLVNFKTEEEMQKAYAALGSVLCSFFYEVANSRCEDLLKEPLHKLSPDKALDLLTTSMENFFELLPIERTFVINKLANEGATEKDILKALEEFDELEKSIKNNKEVQA